MKLQAQRYFFSGILRSFRILFFGMFCVWNSLEGHAQANDSAEHSISIELRGNFLYDDAVDDVPSLLHVREFAYPGISHGIWQDEILVSLDGSFVWELDGLEQPTLFELSAPPWSWMVLVRPNESAKIELMPGKKARGLHGAAGLSRWIGNHPSNALDSLSSKKRALNRQRAASVMRKMNGLNGGEADSIVQQERSLQESFEQAWRLAGESMDAPWARDIWWHYKLSWMSSQGATSAVLDSVWKSSELASDDRTMQERLQSAGWLSAWREVHGNWWVKDNLDWNAINEAVVEANRDSLLSAMAGVLDQTTRYGLELAWLEMALVEPANIVERVWESIPMSAFFQQRYKELLIKSSKGQPGWIPTPVSWTLPNGDLDSLAGQCAQPLKLFLVVKNGSTLALQEREYFNAMIEELEAREMCAFVVSVDSNEEDWNKTVSLRKSIHEEVVWIGNNPQLYEDYGIQSVPSVFGINAQGELMGQLNRLPSSGLLNELKRLLRKR